MKTDKLYMDDIDLEEHWHKAEMLGIWGNPSSAILEGEVFKETALGFPGAHTIGNNDIGISYVQMAIIQSRLGYDDPFFKSSPSKDTRSGHDFSGLQFVVCMGKLNYDWMRNFIDGDFAAKKITNLAAQICRKADSLHSQISEISEYYHVIKAKGFNVDMSTHTDLSGNVSEADWSNRIQIYEALGLLSKLCQSTTNEFKSTGGAPHKYARAWLIMEAVFVYENWNIAGERAGVSLNRNTRLPDGPFVRFLYTFFGIIDGGFQPPVNGEIRNSGLGTEASKILKYLRTQDKFGSHRELSPHSSSRNLAQLLKELIAYRI